MQVHKLPQTLLEPETDLVPTSILSDLITVFSSRSISSHLALNVSQVTTCDPNSLLQVMLLSLVQWFYHLKQTVCSQTSAANIGRLREAKLVIYITVKRMEIRQCVIFSACFCLCGFFMMFRRGHRLSRRSFSLAQDSFVYTLFKDVVTCGPDHLLMWPECMDLSRYLSSVPVRIGGGHTFTETCPSVMMGSLWTEDNARFEQGLSSQNPQKGNLSPFILSEQYIQLFSKFFPFLRWV